jgi:tetratricopeptide (TPR) repeat protein
MSTRQRRNHPTGTPRVGGSENESTEVLRLLNRGADLLQQGQAQEALPHLQRARAMDGTNVAVAINLGGCLIMLGRHREAIPLLEEAVAVEVNNAMIWMNLGAAYLGNPILATAEKQERAIGAFRQALALQPGMPNANYNLGLIFRDQGNWAAALDEFRQALVVNPDDRDARVVSDSIAARLAATDSGEQQSQ